MNILIIYAHPSKESYTYRVLDQLKNHFGQMNWSVEVSDLYEINFRSEMSEHEYWREGFGKLELPIPDDVREQHAKIEKANCVIFLYPVWWSDCPARLKGWFDRVYSVGYAYKQTDGLPKMKVIKYGIALCTAGYSNEFLTDSGIAQSMERVMLDDRFGKRFDQREMIILGGTIELDNVRERHSTVIQKLVFKIEAMLNQ